MIAQIPSVMYVRCLHVMLLTVRLIKEIINLMYFRLMSYFSYTSTKSMYSNWHVQHYQITVYGTLVWMVCVYVIV